MVFFFFLLGIVLNTKLILCSPYTYKIVPLNKGLPFRNPEVPNHTHLM